MSVQIHHGQSLKKDSFEGQMLQGHLEGGGFKESFSKLVKYGERFHKGMPLRPLGLSLWKLSRRRVRFPSLLTLMAEFPSLSAVADL